MPGHPITLPEVAGAFVELINMRNILLGRGSFAVLAICSLQLNADAQGAASDSPLTDSPAPSTSEARMFSRSDGYEAYMGRWSRRLVPQFLAFSAPKNGDRVLDVGTGTGAVAAGLAAMLPASDIVGIDPAEAFIGYAKRSVSAPRVQFEVGNAESLRFPDASFNQTMSLLVMNFIPDHEKALREMRRVTRSGGVISACVWDYNEGMEMTRIFWDEVVALEPSLASKDQRHMKFARQGQLGEAWEKVGLVNVEEQALVIEQPFLSFDDFWQPFLGQTGAAGALVGVLGAGKRLELEQRLRKRVLGDRQNGPFTLRARAWCVRGIVN